jgi:hypothetical protein
VREVGFALLIGAACGPATTPAPSEVRVAINAPAISHAEFAVSPAELGDVDVWARIRHRVHVARIGHATFAVGGPRMDQPNTRTGSAELLPIYPVIGESGDRVRIVVVDDFARLALWIPRADCGPAALVPVRLGDARGTTDQVSGVTLDPGASVVAQPATGGLRQVRIVDEYLDAAGYAPADTIGEVWIAGARAVYDPSTTTTSEPGPTPTGAEVAAGPIREAPRDSAAVIATAKQPLPVRVIRALGPWQEIEIDGRRIRVDGFVPTPAVKTDAPPRGYVTSGHDGSYAITDTIVFDVSDGACLYDREGGDVIGVEVGKKTRYGLGETSMKGWWTVAVSTDWGLMTVVVRDTDEADNPHAARWETCTR